MTIFENMVTRGDRIVNSYILFSRAGAMNDKMQISQNHFNKKLLNIHKNETKTVINHRSFFIP